MEPRYWHQLHASIIRKARNGLIEKGADIESLDVVGYSPLLEAIRYCNAEVAEALLLHGARVDVKTKNGRTVLHVLASTGNLAGTNVLLRFLLAGLSTEVRDSQGTTAWEIFENRVGQPDGI
jgi:ankyrin repeat protein